VVTTGAQLRPEEEEEARGARGTTSHQRSALGARSRDKARPRSRVQASEFPRSELLDQEVKIKPS